jgi:acyl-CoA oxidase
MLLVRSRMPGIFAVQLAQATTIATRYSLVREQGLASEGGVAAETSIIQYKHQHFRLLTLISKSYAIFFAGRACEVAYAQLRQQQERDDYSYLPSVHALTAGMKAYVTAEAADGAEDARKLCGGHGYLSISGLPDIIGACAGGATFEGENYVLWQQVGRYLLKQVDALQQGQPVVEQLQYLASKNDPNTPCAATSKQFLDAEVQLEIYAARAHRLITKAHCTVRGSSKPAADAWNDHMMLIVSASRSHIEYLVLEAFTDTLRALPSTASPSLTITFTRVRDLFALSTITNPGSVDALSFIETTATNPSYLSSAQLDSIRDLVDTLLLHLLPEVVALTDSWNFSDASLCSALGMYDGNVYENIMCWVRQMPINKNASHGTWAQWVDPILKGRVGEKARL